MDEEGKVNGVRSVSSVRLVWEDVLKTGWRDTQCGGSVSGVFPPELITGPRRYLERDEGREDEEMWLGMSRGREG